MSEPRPAIPVDLKRQLLVECGHRCAIPTCRQVPVEFAHIEPWETVRAHEYENMICLCPTCHARRHQGDIDKKSLVIYKRNLAILNGRYSSLEMRLLHYFARNPIATTIRLSIGMEILIMYLLHDGILRSTGRTSCIFVNGEPTDRTYEITPTGRELITKWLLAKEIE